ncbi:glycosyl hydrolase [Parabacteroides johnsonii]|uniref:glycosyl hydrolase n=1 Tax=Parabacteroides johnsonii TaxID=387661 RepID=UPI001896E1EA|nr:glycosyl hydrolase [Parabacteroides johnsonii]
MKKCIEWLLVCFCFFCSCQEKETDKQDPLVDYGYLKTHFQNPDSMYGLNCWWWWLNGNVTREAITKDLEAMKSRHFQGAMIFDAGGHDQRGNKTIPSGPLYGSKDWIDLFVFALDEAKRLGLEMGLNIQSGWNLGGPCVTAQYAAKQLTYSEMKIKGGRSIQKRLKQPDARRDFYKDIVVLAFPANEEDKATEQIKDLDLKLGFHELGGSAPDCRFLLENIDRGRKISKGEDTYIVDLNKVIDLTDLMDANGLLSWTAPEGHWNIMRIGYTCTNSSVSTSSMGWSGYVLDYMSKKAFDFYWDTVVVPVLHAAGDHVGTTLKFMETDSWECGGMNWTDSFAEEFHSFCGYDLRNYLPLIAGHIVTDVNVSNAFLADFRKTLGHLVAQNHYSHFAEKAHQLHMGIQPESAGPHAGPLDGIKNYGFSDIVMSEYWSPSPHRLKSQDRFFVKQASSAAHIYGKKIIGAESFTTIGPHWNDELWHDQKSSFDHEICAGLNRTYFHTFTCSPVSQGLPGQEYFAGTHVNPQVTWWKRSASFINYMRRVQMLVQEGSFVADVLYYYGDHVPNIYPFKYRDAAGALGGFDYDVTDETVFMRLEVKEGRVVAPSGMSYRVLVLPDHRVLSLDVLKKVEYLLKAGAHVIGYRPVKMVTLMGGKEAHAEFADLVNKIWGADVDSKTGNHPYGKGTVSWGMKAKEYLLSQQVATDFSIDGNEDLQGFDYIHYSFGKTQVYFVSNQTDQPQKINAGFRVKEMQPELWNALNGDIRDAVAFVQKDGKTFLPLSFDPYGSIIVVFNKPVKKNKQGDKLQNDPDYEVATTLKGAWTVYFDPKWGGPDSTVFQELVDWTTHENLGIKYYSGTAIYKNKFSFEKGYDRYFLQLGSVKDVGIATVCLNGKKLGTVWTAPFRLDITDALRSGENEVVIEVINSWYNRVAGDEISVGGKKYTQTNVVLRNDFKGRAKSEIALEPSGLLGPVLVMKAIYK